MDFKDYYKTLDVATDADLKTIKTAYRRLARKYHPDVSSEHDAEKQFKEVSEAYEVLSDDAIANAIVVGGMGRERNLLVDDRLKEFTPTTNIKGPVNREGIRKMTPREWARLQGFPDRFEIPVSDAQAYKQFGNSVAIPAVHATAKSLIRALQG